MNPGSLTAAELAHLLKTRVPEHVRDAVALGILAGESRATIEVMGSDVTFEWNNSRVEADGASEGLEYECHAVGMLVMRCLPVFQEHPALRLVPKRTYALPARLLPDYYVQRFESDPTQLDGNVLFKYHRGSSCWFQLPHSNPAFDVGWATLWDALRAGQIV